MQEQQTQDPRALLLILDGAGYSEETFGNAVTGETLPTLFGQMERDGFAVLEAAAGAVGLEAGQVGNSEAGHLTIGAGRKVPCMSRRIDETVRSGSWGETPGWRALAEKGVVHILGLASDAGVHGLMRSMIQAAQTASEVGLDRIVVHPVLDGVDSLAGTAPGFLEELRSALAAVPRAKLGVVIGRRWFCDRSGNLEVARVAADAFRGQNELAAFQDEILAAHLAEHGGEVEFPPHLCEGGEYVGAGEPVLITSHRADRARQIAQVLGETQPVYMLIDPGKGVSPEHVFFPQSPLEQGLAFELKRAGVPSVRIAEKCKFPHVTFFFNGFDTEVEGEGICIPSIPEHEIPEQPSMSLEGVKNEILQALKDPARRAIVANLANLDQVGHLGRFDLAVCAADAVDRAFQEISEACRQGGWTLLVTADHGNADRVTAQDGGPFGSHTDRPVPLYVQPAPDRALVWREQRGSLANVAATFLVALGLEPPSWMEPPLVHLEPGELRAHAQG